MGIQDEINTIKVLKSTLEQDYVKALEYALPVLQHPLASSRSSSLLSRCNLLHGCSSAYYLLGELSEAEQICQETIRLAKEAGIFNRHCHAAHKKSHIYRVTGHLHQALRFINETLEFFRQPGKQDYYPLADLYCRLSDLYYEWNDFDTAQRMVTESLRIDEMFEVPTYLVGSLNAQGHLLIAQGDLEGAEDTLQKAAELMRKSVCWPPFHWENERCFVKLWLAGGDLPSADHWVQEHQSSASESSSFAQEAYEIARARIFIAQGRFNEAVDLIGRLGRSAQAGGRNGRLIEIRVLEALTQKAIGEREKSFSALEQALLLGEGEGYLRVFLDEGETMRLLIHEFQGQLNSPESKNNPNTRLSDYVDHLLAIFNETATLNKKTAQ
jgi:LuxR family maltose regulon positive regulatory protein